jgi:hypothetical protein
VILRTIASAIVALSVIAYYRDNDDVPNFCVALVAASLVGQVFLVRKGNLLPFFRAWLIIGSIVAFVYPLDFVRTKVYDPPSGMSYIAAFVGFFIAGLFSMAEGRSFWYGRCLRDESDCDEE